MGKNLKLLAAVQTSADYIDASYVAIELSASDLVSIATLVRQVRSNMANGINVDEVRVFEPSITIYREIPSKVCKRIVADAEFLNENKEAGLGSKWVESSERYDLKRLCIESDALYAVANIDGEDDFVTSTALYFNIIPGLPDLITNPDLKDVKITLLESTLHDMVDAWGDDHRVAMEQEGDEHEDDCSTCRILAEAKELLQPDKGGAREIKN